MGGEDKDKFIDEIPKNVKKLYQINRKYEICP